MAPNCPICFENYQEPVCLPCGHIYCKDCLSDQVNAHTNAGLTSTCPDCQAVFNLAVPDLTYLPHKYHPFITHAIRRVFTDLTPASSDLENEIKALEARLAAQHKTEEKLIERCEDLSGAMHMYRAREQETNCHAANLDGRLKEVCRKLRFAEREVEELRGVVRVGGRERELLWRDNCELAGRVRELEVKFGFSPSATQSGYYPANDLEGYEIDNDHEREDDVHAVQASSSNAQASASSSTSASSASTWASKGERKKRPVVLKRAIKPLPRRASKTRDREDDGDDDAAVIGMRNAKRLRAGYGKRG